MLPLISPIDAAALLADGKAILIDVREADEFSSRHVPAALSRPLSVADAGPLVCGSGIDMIFTCLSGGRTSANVARLAALAPAGRGHILAGGINAWGKAGLPLTGSSQNAGAAPLPIMRQVQIAAGALVLAGVLLSVLAAPAWILLSAFVGAGLTFAGASGWCGMARLLAVMPWNRAAA